MTLDEARELLSELKKVSAADRKARRKARMIRARKHLRVDPKRSRLMKIAAKKHKMKRAKAARMARKLYGQSWGK